MRVRRSVLETSRRGVSIFSHDHPGGGTPFSAPGRVTTTTVASLRTSSPRSHVGSPAAASLPTTRNSSLVGSWSRSASGCRPCRRRRRGRSRVSWPRARRPRRPRPRPSPIDQLRSRALEPGISATGRARRRATTDQDGANVARSRPQRDVPHAAGRMCRRRCRRARPSAPMLRGEAINQRFQTRRDPYLVRRSCGRQLAETIRQ